MLVPLSWLREYVDINISPEELADRLDLTGTAVESVKRLGAGLEGVVVGLVVDCEKHPHADKLKVCLVDIGEDPPRRIVCGAPNVEAGQLVPVALPGAELPGGIRIGKAKIRGIESEGMICSEAELRLGENASGIMVLEGPYEVGSPLAEAMGLDDAVFELEITPNRPDCLGIIGVAREVAAVTGSELKIPKAEVEEGERQAAEAASVEIADPDLCPRYEARLIMGVKIGPSPLWMRQRLEKAGVRPISNIVDVTNYVMLETGQPLHAFDYELIEGFKVIVRRARKGERIVTLDGVERLLTEDDLVIADEEKAIAIAGIMGGEYSEVSDKTTNVLLEAAHFKPESVMRTSRRLGLLSEASARFEKGVDPNVVPFAADRAIELMRRLAGGEVLKGKIDVYPKRIEPRKLRLRVSRANDILGTDLDARQVSGILASLGLTAKPAAEEPRALEVEVPTFRFDLEREIDLVEEVARIYGYNAVKSTLPEGGAKQGGLSVSQKMLKAVADRLVAQGLYEAQTYSFSDPRDADLMNLPSGSPLRASLALLNPLSEDQSLMRTSILPGLLKAVRHNIYREQRTVRLFEIGKVFHPIEGERLPMEKRMLAIALAGVTHVDEWYEKGRQIDFYDLKGLIEDLLQGIGVGDWTITRSDDPRFHPGRSGTLAIAGEYAGEFGQIHPSVQEKFDLPYPAMAAEIDAELMIQAGSFARYFAEIPRFPSVVLDIALIVNEATGNEELVRAIESEGGKLLESVRVFDVFKGPGIPEGKKSIAYSLTFRSAERTLTDEEAMRARDMIVERVRRDFGAAVRE